MKHAEPRSARTALRYLLALFFWQALGQDHSASTQRQNLKSAGPRARIVQLGCDARNVKQQKEQKNDRSQESSRQSCRFSSKDCCARGNEDRAGEIRPKRSPQKPGRTQSRCETRVNNMLNPESHKSYGKKISPEFEGRSRGFAPC